MAVATLTFADRLAAEVERKRSQLVVGLDPNPDLLPVELRGDVARFCCGIVDAVAPHAVAVKPQLAFFEALGAARDGGVRPGLQLRPPGRAARDRRRQARRHRLDRTRLRGGVPRGRPAARRRADRQPVARPRRDRAVPRRRPARRCRHLRARAHLERRRRPAGRRAQGRPPDVAPRRERWSTSGARSRPARSASRRSAPSSARRIRAPSPTRGG